MAYMQIQTEFKSKFGDKAKTASANAFDRQFSSRLKYHMEYCMNNPGEISKIHRVKAKVDEVKGIMVQNIERV
jgi:vesicle-associated membrane protein 7